MAAITVNHEEIYYVQHGSAGVPLVCLHGAGGTHAGWYNAVKLLERVSAVVPDLPAHGRSTGQGRSTVAAYAAVVSDLLDALHLPAGSGPQVRAPTKSSEQVAAVPGAESHGPPVVLAGHSMGGAIALWLALHQPERVRGLILAGTGAKLRVHPDTLQAAKEGRPLGASGARPASERQASGLPHRRVGGSAPPAAAAPEVVYGDWLACDTFNVMDRLGAIHVPTLVLVGANDVMTPPKYAGFLAQGIKGATLVTIADAGHSAMAEQPAAVAAAMQTFLDSLPAAA